MAFVIILLVIVIFNQSVIDDDIKAIRKEIEDLKKIINGE